MGGKDSSVVPLGDVIRKADELKVAEVGRRGTKLVALEWTRGNRVSIEPLELVVTASVRPGG